MKDPVELVAVDDRRGGPAPLDCQVAPDIEIAGGIVVFIAAGNCDTSDPMVSAYNGSASVIAMCYPVTGNDVLFSATMGREYQNFL